jgi:hypothetical protein
MSPAMIAERVKVMVGISSHEDHSIDIDVFV